MYLQVTITVGNIIDMIHLKVRTQISRYIDIDEDIDIDIDLVVPPSLLPSLPRGQTLITWRQC